MIYKTGLILLSLFLLSVSAEAQKPASGLIVNSNPPGATAILEGPVTLNGLTPVSFPSELQGKYKLTVKEKGYETYHQNLFLLPDKSVDLTLSLKPKTRFKASLRSLIIPGWGQMYSGQKTKGVFFTLLAAGATGFYFIANDDYNSKYDDYRSTLSDYNGATTVADKETLYNRLAASKKDAYDAEDTRQIAIGTVAAVWGLSLIDILFFFPSERGNVATNSLSIKPDYTDGGAQLVFTHTF